jgi:AcrR family transcriptional regulator
LIRSQSTAEPRREALVSAAFAEIARRGFEGLRTREVAGAVGVNIATLHYYFPHKEDLIKAVVARALARFRDTLGGRGPAAEQLRSHFQGVRRLAREEPELFSVMAELALRATRDPSLRGLMRKADDAWLATLRALLTRARDEGALPPEVDVEGIAPVIIAALRGTFMLPSPRPEQVERTIRQLESLVGLRPVARGRARVS